MSDHKQVIIKAEPANLFRKKLILMLIGILPFLYVGVAGLLKLMGERGYLAKLLWRYFPIPFIISLAVIAAALCLHFLYRSRVIFSKTPKGELQVEIKNFNDKNGLFKYGEWTTGAYFKKEYFKYGTYQKDLFLTLYCNGEPFCVFRHKTSAAQSAPEGFIESDIHARLLWNGPVFFTSETARIYGIVQQYGKVKKPDVGYYTNH